VADQKLSAQIGRPVSGEAMTSTAPDIKVLANTIVQLSCVDTGDAIGVCNSVFAREKLHEKVQRHNRGENQDYQLDVYLTVTQELLQHAGERFRGFVAHSLDRVVGVPQ